MSFRRLPEPAYRQDARGIPTGPNGRRLCRFCQKEVPKGMRVHCSTQCAREMEIRRFPNVARWEVAQRDKGVCALCGFDTRAIKQGLSESNYSFYKRRKWEMDHIIPVCEGGGECGLENLRTLCIPCHRKVTAELARKRAAAKRPPNPAPPRPKPSLQLGLFMEKT